MNTLSKKRAKASSLGGQAVINKPPPTHCPRCNQSMKGRSYHSYLGHLGLHGLADKYFNGDMQATQKRLQQNGLARQDPFPGNGAWNRYVPIRQEPPIELPF